MAGQFHSLYPKTIPLQFFFLFWFVFGKLLSSLSCSSGPLYTHRRAPGTPLRPYVAGTCLETGKLEITLATRSASITG